MVRCVQHLKLARRLKRRRMGGSGSERRRRRRGRSARRAGGIYGIVRGVLCMFVVKYWVP